jgi:hypothetical protein
MYRGFIPLGELKKKPQRIYDPFSYQTALSEILVPVAPDETIVLAGVFPLVWVMTPNGETKLCALRGLSKDQKESLPVVRRLGFDGLPHILKAYPFRMSVTLEQKVIVGVDRVLPVKENNIGANVFEANGHLTDGAKAKLAHLKSFAQGQGMLRHVFKVVRDAQLLEPVVIPDDISATYQLPPMFAISRELEKSPAADLLTRSHGQAFANLYAHLRISLFRFGPMFSSVRRVLAIAR